MTVLLIVGAVLLVWLLLWGMCRAAAAGDRQLVQDVARAEPGWSSYRDGAA